MSAVIIEIRSEGYGHSIGRTTVYVEGKFCYQSGNAVSVEQDHIEKLIKALLMENTEVRVKR